MRRTYGSPYISIYTEWTRWPPFASPFACYSNTRHGQLQPRRKSYDTKRTLQPLTQARTQASCERIAPTNLPPRSRISQDPKRSSQHITPLYNAHRKATKKNTQQHNRCEGSENRSSPGLRQDHVLLSVLRIVPHLAYAAQTYIRQNHVILNIAQIQHHPTFIGISCSLYISS